MWTVEHLALDGDDAGRGVGCERSYDLLCARDGVGRRREDIVDDGNLCRVNGHLAGEPVAARLFAFVAQKLEVAEIRRNGVDGLDARRGGREQREGASDAE